MSKAQSWQTWALGVFVSLSMLLGGWTYTAQADLLVSLEQRVDQHAERIAKLEALYETQVETNKRLADANEKISSALLALLKR